MKKWKFAILLLIIVFLFVQAYRIYANVQGSQKEEQELAKSRVLKETNITNVDDISFYYGNKVYQVIKGTNGKGDTFIAWVPESEKNNIIVYKEEKGLTKEQVKEHVIKKRDPLSIKEIRLGMEKNKPLWEVTYIDQEHRFTYYYIDFFTGDFLKRYSLKTRQFKGEF